MQGFGCMRHHLGRYLCACCTIAKEDFENVILLFSKHQYEHVQEIDNLLFSPDLSDASRNFVTYYLDNETEPFKDNFGYISLLSSFLF